MKSRIPLFQVDAFAEEVFQGNPAGVCVLDKWIPDNVMQQIAAENNLAETAFVVPTSEHYEIRWFTPTVEVDLCGHATLASAHVLFNHGDIEESTIDFHSIKSGILSVEKQDKMLTLNFPVDQVTKVGNMDVLTKALGKEAVATYRGKTDYLLIFSSQEEIESLKPDFNLLMEIDRRGIIVSAKGDEVDFVSRFFAPQVGINEDPVTGSAHTTLTPIWSNKLEKHELSARQLSQRGGNLKCKLEGDRVKISGQAITYLIGEILIS